MKRIFFIILTMKSMIGFGQNYTSYFTGNSSDITTNPIGGVCLMGGATEDDNAMKWFLQRANGGDVLVLRASGSNGYNSYLYSGLGVTINSVETIVFNNATASSDPYVIRKIQQAEAIWFAGGDQWSYITYWRNSPVNNAINQSIQQRNIVIGGTSAGMAILGQYYFSAQNGTVTTATALANPYNTLVTVDSAAFIFNRFLTNTITDTHFDNPDRKGRLVVFLARISTDFGRNAKAIACDEYTAVCIDDNGIARVFGGYPTYDDNAYFIQSNCELGNQTPENCIAGSTLTWNHGGEALKVYQIKGDASGSKTFNLNNWQDGTGGLWYNWSVLNGVFSELPGTDINCFTTSEMNLSSDSFINIYPNPASDVLLVTMNMESSRVISFSVFNQLAQRINIPTSASSTVLVADLSCMRSGIYFIKIELENGSIFLRKIVKAD